MIPRAAAALRCATAFQWNNGNDCGRASAADLKFLHRLRQTHFRNFKSKSGTRIICLLVPLLLPKFVSEGAAMYHELRKRGTRAADLKFLHRLRQTHFRNFKSKTGTRIT